MNTSPEVQAYLAKVIKIDSENEAKTLATAEATAKQKLAIQNIIEFLQQWVSELEPQEQKIGLTVDDTGEGFRLTDRGVNIDIMPDPSDKTAMRIRHRNWIISFRYHASPDGNVWKLSDGSKIDGQEIFVDRAMANLILNESIDNKFTPQSGYGRR